MLCLCGAVLVCLRCCSLFRALLPSWGWRVFCVVACCVCVLAVGPGCPLLSPGGSWWLLVSCLGGVLWCVPGCRAAPCCCALCRLALRCSALCCFVLLRLVLPRAVLCPGALSAVLGSCAFWRRVLSCTPALCVFLLWCVAAWCCSPLCFVLSAPWGVVLCVSCRLRPVRCCCVARSPSYPHTRAHSIWAAGPASPQEEGSRRGESARPRTLLATGPPWTAGGGAPSAHTHTRMPARGTGVLAPPRTPRRAHSTCISHGKFAPQPLLLGTATRQWRNPRPHAKHAPDLRRWTQHTRSSGRWDSEAAKETPHKRTQARTPTWREYQSPPRTARPRNLRRQQAAYPPSAPRGNGATVPAKAGAPNSTPSPAPTTERCPRWDARPGEQGGRGATPPPPLPRARKPRGRRPPPPRGRGKVPPTPARERSRSTARPPAPAAGSHRNRGEQASPRQRARTPHRSRPEKAGEHKLECYGGHAPHDQNYASDTRFVACPGKAEGRNEAERPPALLAPPATQTGGTAHRPPPPPQTRPPPHERHGPAPRGAHSPNPGTGEPGPDRPPPSTPDGARDRGRTRGGARTTRNGRTSAQCRDRPRCARHTTQGGGSGRRGSGSAHTRKGHAGTTRRATRPSLRNAQTAWNGVPASEGKGHPDGRARHTQRRTRGAGRGKRERHNTRYWPEPHEPAASAAHTRTGHCTRQGSSGALRHAPTPRLGSLRASTRGSHWRQASIRGPAAPAPRATTH